MQDASGARALQPCQRPLERISKSTGHSIERSVMYDLVFFMPCLGIVWQSHVKVDIGREVWMSILT